MPGGGLPFPAWKVRSAMDQVVVYRHNTLYKGSKWDAVGCYAKMVGFVQGSV